MFPFKKPKRRGTQLGILLAGNALCPVGLITQAVAAEPDNDPPLPELAEPKSEEKPLTPAEKIDPDLLGIGKS